MYYNNEVISYLQANKILALKLDHALTGVGKAVSSQIETIGAGATRALFPRLLINAFIFMVICIAPSFRSVYAFSPWPPLPSPKKESQQEICWLNVKRKNYLMPYFFSVTNFGSFQFGPFTTLPF